MHSPRKSFFSFVGISLGLILVSYIAYFAISGDMEPDILQSKGIMLLATIHQQIVTLGAALIAIYIGYSTIYTPNIDTSSIGENNTDIQKSPTSTSRWSQVKEFIYKRWTRKGRSLFWKWSVGGYVGFILRNIGAAYILDVTGRDIPGLQGEQSTIMDILNMGIQGRERIIVFVMVALIAPAVEELVFRTMFTDQNMERRGYTWIVFVALVFSAIHGEFAVFRDLTILALILGVIYYKTGSTRYSFAFHVIVNGVSVIALSQGMV